MDGSTSLAREYRREYQTREIAYGKEYSGTRELPATAPVRRSSAAYGTEGQRFESSGAR
jgi:hypothetical protein